MASVSFNKRMLNWSDSDEKENAIDKPFCSSSIEATTFLRLTYTKLKTFPATEYIQRSKQWIEWCVRKGISMIDKNPAAHLQVRRVMSLGKRLWGLNKEDFPLRTPGNTPLLVISSQNEANFLKVKKELIAWSNDHPIRENEPIDLSTQIGLNAYMLDLLLNEIDSDRMPEGSELISAWDEMGNLQGIALFSKENCELALILKGFWNCKEFAGKYPRLQVQGVGSALIEQTFFTSMKLNPQCLGAFRLQANDGAVPFYRKLGFEKDGTRLQLSSAKISVFLSGKYSGRAVF